MHCNLGVTTATTTTIPCRVPPEDATTADSVHDQRVQHEAHGHRGQRHTCNLMGTGTGGEDEKGREGDEGIRQANDGGFP